MSFFLYVCKISEQLFQCSFIGTLGWMEYIGHRMQKTSGGIITSPLELFWIMTWVYSSYGSIICLRQCEAPVRVSHTLPLLHLERIRKALWHCPSGIGTWIPDQEKRLYVCNTHQQVSRSDDLILLLYQNIKTRIPILLVWSVGGGQKEHIRRYRCAVKVALCNLQNNNGPPGHPCLTSRFRS